MKRYFSQIGLLFIIIGVGLLVGSRFVQIDWHNWLLAGGLVMILGGIVIYVKGVKGGSLY